MKEILFKEFKKGDIILFKNNDLFGKIITLFTGGIYSHCAIYFDFNYIVEVSPINLDLYPLIKKRNKYDVYRIENYNEKLIEKNFKELLYTLSKVKAYDWFQATCFMFINHLRRINKKWFASSKYVICSEVVANFLDACECKKKDCNIENSLMTPSDIIKYFNIKKVY